MAEGHAQDRTEEPTARKLRKARDDGQVARSIELPAAAVVIVAFLMLAMTGGWLVSQLAGVFASGFVFSRKAMEQPLLLPGLFGEQLLAAFVLVLPLVMVLMVVGILASGLTGGYLFSFSAVAPKGAKINPLAGLKRMFGVKAVVELGKALLKFTLVTGVLAWLVVDNIGQLMQFGRMELEPALAGAGALIAKSSLLVGLSLAVIAAIDVPYQKHEFRKRMRMSKQEVKDEMKDLEGRPEVKAHIRRRQREMANARMIQRVKEADVVITNPEHFAVALEYDPTSSGAPTVVAKGADFLAAQIRSEATLHGIHLFEAPELARALYFTTEQDQPIPEALYQAVAPVIAYVFSLEAAVPGQPGMARPFPKVPASMLFDPEGQPMASPQDGRPH